MSMTDHTPEPDEATDPNPADLEQATIADLETYEEAGPGSPTAEELAADRNLFPLPEPTGDEVNDGTQLAGGDPGPESGGDADDPDGEV
jgi:hypothetical protein